MSILLLQIEGPDSGAWLMKNNNRKSPPQLRSRPESQTTKRNVSFNQGDEDDDDEKDGLKVYLDEEDREAEGVKFERLSRRSLHVSNREILLVEDVTPALLTKVLTKARAKKLYDQINENQLSPMPSENDGHQDLLSFLCMFRSSREVLRDVPAQSVRRGPDRSFT